MWKAISSLSLCLLGAAPSLGAIASEFECQQSVFYEKLTELRLGRIEKVEKVIFIADRSTQNGVCPSADKACQTKSYVVRGDEVLLTKNEGSYLCAVFKSKKGSETVGWLPREQVTLITEFPNGSSAWVGAWRADAETRIKIASRGADKLEVAGAATYGASDPERVRRGTVNEGSLSGVYVPKNGLIGVGENYDGSRPPSDASDAGCEARLQLLGGYLVVDDNMQCGGMNVRFNGIYLRQDGKK